MYCNTLLTNLARKFCNCKCAALFNSPKRAPTRICHECKAEFKRTLTNKTRFCSRCVVECLDSDRRARNLTLRYYADKCKRENVSTHQKWSPVRYYARRWNDHLPRKCIICAYDKHVEFAHIKGIASFDLDTRLSVVNAESNIAILCPNHHWELDNGLLQWAHQDSNPEPIACEATALTS